jgi:cytochrome c-type biogenesis protein CcmH/NrfF
MSNRRRWLPWVALVFVLGVALVVGSGAGQHGGSRHHAETEDHRVKRIASEVRCPTCRGLSAAESDAKAAQAVRDEIRHRVEAHQSEGAIKAYLASASAATSCSGPREGA